MDDTNEDNRSDTNILLGSYGTCESCGYKGKTYEYETKECPNLIPTKVPKLEEMASVSLAIGLWSHISSPYSLTDRKLRRTLKWGQNECDRVSEMTDKLPLPESFKEDIANNIRKLSRHMDKWVFYHTRKVFEGECRSEYRYVNYIVWHPNGVVNYYKTALNLLKSNELSDSEKYRLACTYCMKDEIEKRWPQYFVENEASLEAEFPNYTDALFCYWDCYCAGELHLFPVPEGLSINEFMFLRSDVDNWPAIEYFFDRLTVEQKVVCAICFIDGENYQYQELLLLKLNESQRTQVYVEKAVRIMQNCLSLGKLCGFRATISREVDEHQAISTWYEIRDLITWPQFVALINRLLRDKPPVSNDFLMEIWTSSYDELKFHLLHHSDYDFIGEIFYWTSEENKPHIYRFDDRKRRGCDFFFAALEEATKAACKPLAMWSYSRRKYFYRVCNTMTQNGEIEWLTRVLNLCVPDAQDCDFMKQELKEICRAFDEKTMVSIGCEKLVSAYEFSKLEQFVNFFYPDYDDPESREEVRDVLLENLKFVDSYCLNFYLDGKVNELNERLAPLISSYPDIILDYKKYLLFSPRGLSACYSHFDSTTNVLTEIVSDGLPDENDVIKFGKMIIFSGKGLNILHKLLRDERFPKEVVKRNIDLLLKSNGSKRKLKQELLDSLPPQERRTDPLAKKKYYLLLTSFFGF